MGRGGGEEEDSKLIDEEEEEEGGTLRRDRSVCFAGWIAVGGSDTDYTSPPLTTLHKSHNSQFTAQCRTLSVTLCNA